MYKFVVIQGSCGAGYSLSSAESACTKMETDGFELVQAYPEVVQGCGNSGKYSLVMIFRQKSQ